MKRVFVFCIGGTGLRVMKSVTMLLAAGMDAKGFTVVPVLIDPHLDLNEKADLQTLIGQYESIYNSCTLCDGKRLNPTEGFFGTDIADLAKLNGQKNDISEPIAEKRSFGQYINVGKLQRDDINNFLVQTLFSQANLDNDLSVGFKGSPNVGTVVLGEMIEGADWFQAFSNACQKGDRIFIISSIFGGTGASGFPLLEKMVRNSKSHPNVSQALMGAVTVLPYFSLDDPSLTGSDIDSSNFLTKAKAALSYYADHIKSDFLYYAGEQGMKVTYSNDEKLQEDKAHFVELVAASALFDFLSKSDDRPDTSQALSRAVKEDVESLSILSLGDAYKEIVKTVADMTLLSRLVYLLPDEKSFPLKKNRRFNDSFYRDQSFVELKEFLGRFEAWRVELAENKRSFAPLNVSDLRDRKALMTHFVDGLSLDAKDESYFLLDMIRASNRDKDSTHSLKFRRFMDYAYKAIDKYTSKILNN